MDHSCLMYPGEQHPQRHSHGLLIGQHNMPLNAPDDSKDQRASMDRFRPRLDKPMTK